MRARARRVVAKVEFHFGELRVATWSLTSLQQRLVMMVSNCTSCSDILGSAFYVIGVSNPLFGGLLDLGCERHA